MARSDFRLRWERAESGVTIQLYFTGMRRRSRKLIHDTGVVREVQIELTTSGGLRLSPQMIVSHTPGKTSHNLSPSNESISDSSEFRKVEGQINSDFSVKWSGTNGVLTSITRESFFLLAELELTDPRP